MTNLSKYKEDLKKLLDTAEVMGRDLTYRTYSEEKVKKLKAEEQDLIKKLNMFFETHYQSWYTEASAVIKQLIPDRLNEFVELYKGDGKRKGIDAMSFNIQDW